MTYAEAVARLLALRGGEHAGMRPGLERMEALLAALGHPEERYTLVQVGGSNGNGSVFGIEATMLRAAGRRVGLYTSPHLCSFRERIRVDGAAIAADAVADGVEVLGTLVARLDASMFEATTALALDHFAREAVEIAVLEVGLGGRLDATTVGVPAATVVTRIDLDHQAVLGSSLAEIAAEKAAIIRAGAAFSAAQSPEAMHAIEGRAVAAGVPLAREGHELSVRVRRRGLDGQHIDCGGPDWMLTDLWLALLGTFQPSNALLAVAAARHLGVPDTAIREGLRRVRWPGRFDVIEGEPRLVLDGAHNPGGARALADSLRALFSGERITLVIGASRDKDLRGILAPLVPLARRVILTGSSSPRAADPAALRAALPLTDARVETTESAAEALALALDAGGTPIVCVAGSLFLVGDVLTELAGTRDKPCPIEKGADSMGSLF